MLSVLGFVDDMPHDSLELTNAPDAIDPLKTGSGAPSPANRTLEQSIGAQIRLYRKLHNHTVAELAAAAAASPPACCPKLRTGRFRRP